MAWQSGTGVAWMDVLASGVPKKSSSSVCDRVCVVDRHRSVAFRRCPLARKNEGLPPVPPISSRTVSAGGGARTATRAGDSDGAMSNRARQPATQVTAGGDVRRRRRECSTPRRCRVLAIGSIGTVRHRRRAARARATVAAKRSLPIDARRCRPLN